LLAIYRLNTLHSLREQFWGRAALAPEVLIGSGRFSLRAKTFPQIAKSGGSGAETAATSRLNQSMTTQAIWLRETSRKGAATCDFRRDGASDQLYGFLYNERVRVRKEDHGWIGCFGSERCKL
jgi:hypothetical protein